MRIRIVFVLIMSILALAPDLAFSADIPDLPLTTEIQRSEDRSAAVLADIFGKEWTDITNISSTTLFGSLVSGVLGFVNLAAMIYVAAMVSYIWIVAVISTAHEGKRLGGGVFNSLWVPIRHAFAFSMTIPVLGGYSVMQIMIMGCIAFSINMANILWNNAAESLINLADAHIAGVVSRGSAHDASAMIPSIFQESVVTRVFEDYAKNNGDEIWALKYEKADIENSGKKAKQEWPVDFGGNYNDKEGRVLLEIDYEHGTAWLSPRLPKNMAAGKSARFNITFPAWNCREKYTDESMAWGTQYVGGDQIECVRPSGKDYADKFSVYRTVLVSVLDLWEKIDKYAEKYLATDAGGCAVLNGKQCGNGEDLGLAFASDFKKIINDYANKYNSELLRIAKERNQIEENNWRGELKKVFGAEKGKSGTEFGWITAGIYPFAISSLQKRATEIFNPSVGVYQGDLWTIAFEQAKKGSFLNDWQKAGIKNTPGFLDAYLNKSHYYVAKKMSRESVGANSPLKAALIRAFTGDESSGNAGALGYILKRASQYDPIVSVSDFGDRLLSAAQTLFGVGAGTAAVSLVVLKRDIGGLAIVIMSFAVAFMGMFFAYAAPAIPLLFWCGALFSWLIIIVEAFIAAPFWVCSHALSPGDGFAGRSARRGYLMLFDIVARPSLMVVGSVFAVAVSQISAIFMSKLFSLWFINDAAKINFASDIVYSILVAGMLYYIYYLIFTTGVLYMPKRITQWSGGVASRGLNNEEDITGKAMLAGGSERELKGLATAGANGIEKTANGVGQLSGSVIGKIAPGQSGT